MTLTEVEIVMQELNRHVEDHTQILFGTSVDGKMGNRMSVTLISSIASDGAEAERTERFSGKFRRSVTLPTRIDAGKVSATYKDGILTVTLPKAEEAKPKKIEVSVE